ncbi:MAG: hypothetical protein AAGG80_05895 [Pseudomonadota bacterium]
MPSQNSSNVNARLETLSTKNTLTPEEFYQLFVLAKLSHETLNSQASEHLITSSINKIKLPQTFLQQNPHIVSRYKKLAQAFIAGKLILDLKSAIYLIAFGISADTLNPQEQFIRDLIVNFNFDDEIENEIKNQILKKYTKNFLDALSSAKQQLMIKNIEEQLSRLTEKIENENLDDTDYKYLLNDDRTNFNIELAFTLTKTNREFILATTPNFNINITLSIMQLLNSIILNKPKDKDKYKTELMDRLVKSKITVLCLIFAQAKSSHSNSSALAVLPIEMLAKILSFVDFSRLGKTQEERFNLAYSVFGSYQTKIKPTSGLAVRQKLSTAPDTFAFSDENESGSEENTGVNVAKPQDFLR